MANEHSKWEQNINYKAYLLIKQNKSDLMSVILCNTV